jgi:hypothetical protein
MRKTVLQFVCVLLLSAATTLWSQTGAGTLSGRVTNATGAGVPNAAVTVTNVNSNASVKALTGSDGTFSVAGLAPGTYRVDIETAGYKRTSQQNIELAATGPATVNITLEAGSINESVELKGTAPAIQTGNAEHSVGLGTRTVRELPIQDRNHQELVGLQPGVSPPTPAIDPVRDPDRNRFYAVNGQSPVMNQQELDGVNNLEPFRGTAIRVAPAEAIQQKNVSTASLTAEKGYTGGAWVTDVTRPGTNDWHGSLFEIYSGNFLATRNFLNSSANGDPKFNSNQFGGTVGGPVVRDKTFFFGSYEGTYQRGGMTQLLTVPTAQFIGGNFSGLPGFTLFNPNSGVNGVNRTAFTNTTIPADQINPTAAAIAGFFPAPNLPGFVNNYVANVPYRKEGNKFDGKIDQHFTDRTAMFVRYGYTNWWSGQGSPLGDVIGAGTRDRLVGQNAIVDVAHEFGPRLITDFRMGYNRYEQKLGLWGSQAPLFAALGLNNSNNLIGINIAGFPAIGAPANIPQHPVDNNFNWVWSWTLHTSMHNLKFGTDIRRYRVDGFMDSLFPFGSNGAAFFGPGTTLTNNGAALSQFGGLYNSFAAFLLGAPTQVGVSNFFTTPSIRQTQFGFWLGDTVQIMNHVTLDVGVRYDVFGPLEPRNAGGAAFFDPLTNTFSFAGVGNNGMQWADYDTNNIAPRVGLAFKLSPKTVLRAGYSMEYFQVPYMYSGFVAPTFGSVAGVQGGFAVAPFSGAFGPTVSSTTPPPGSLQNGASAGNLPATVIPQHFDTPYVQSFNAQIQQEFYWGTVLDIGYVGTLGRHLPSIQELNAALPGAGAAGLPFFAMGRTASTLGFDNSLTNNYNSLQVSLNKRFAHGLAFTGSYTWSKALGYTGANNFLLNPFDLRSNYGPLDYDRQHVLTIAHLWELPFGRHGSNIVSTLLGGWQLNGVFTWSTGTPLTITADPLLCACPGNTVTANFNGGAFAGTNGAFINPAAFSAPAAGQFGTTGRGMFRGPDYTNYDMSLFKKFKVRDRFNLELRGEAFNLSNTPHFANPVTNINSPDFGQSVTTVNGIFGRQIDVGARVLF